MTPCGATCGMVEPSRRISVTLVDAKLGRLGCEKDLGGTMRILLPQPHGVVESQEERAG